MSIETEVPGSPESVRRAADWVGTVLLPALATALEAFVDARTVAGGDWRGEAGAAFEAAVGRAISSARPLVRSAAELEAVLLDYASSLESCQWRMEEIMGDALALGLSTSGSVIEAPVDGGPLVAAYDDLSVRAAEVWVDLQRAGNRVAAEERAMDGAAWTFTLGGVAGDVVGDIVASRLRTTPLAGLAADELARTSRLGAVGRLAPTVLGPAMALGGAVYDYRVRGESAEQAVASNAGGFAASVAGGALVGTAIGGPLGTVVGGAVGAAAGVFTSGTIDGLWEHDGDVSDALAAGWDTVEDTAQSLLDAGGEIVDEIGGLLD